MKGKKIVFMSLMVTGIISCILSACVQPEKNDGSKRINRPSAVSLVNEDPVIYLIPPPGEIFERFQSTRIEYNEGLLNPVSNKDRYFGSMSQSLNLGIYIADMAYLILFERFSRTVDYLETIRLLSYEAGISGSVFESLITRAKASAGIMDTLFIISNEAFNGMLEFLEDGGKENIIALISAGAYIESLYLVLHSTGEYSENSRNIDLISDMIYPLDNIMERAGYVEDDENVKNILAILTTISEIFNELQITDIEMTIKERDKGKISVLGGEEINLDEKGFYELKNSITEIRNNIVNN